MRNIHYAGEVAFLETALGLTEVKVLKVIQPGNGWTNQGMLLVEVIRRSCGFKRGENVESVACHVIPPIHVTHKPDGDIIHIGFIWSND